MTADFCETITLYKGRHSPGNQMCLLEAVAVLAGEPWTDHPGCVSPCLATFLRAWNDGMDDADRQQLRPLIPLLIGTAAPRALELGRAWLASHWLLRVALPTWLGDSKISLLSYSEALRQAPATTADDWNAARDRKSTRLNSSH